MIRFIAVLVTVLFSLAGTGVRAQETDTEGMFEGLVKVPDSKASVAYVLPEADFSVYKRVAVLRPLVAFKKNWKREHRGVSNADMERIKERMANLFEEVFRDVLEEGGYPVVTDSGDDVLVVRPAIINLDAHAPDTMNAGRSTTFVTSAGEATLYVELYDSVTSTLLAKAMDRRFARDMDRMQWASSVYNRAEAAKIIKHWASILRDRLDEIHGRAPN